MIAREAKEVNHHRGHINQKESGHQGQSKARQNHRGKFTMPENRVGKNHHLNQAHQVDQGR